MAKLYKLTDENGQTRGNTQWGPGVTHKATGVRNQALCSSGWIHAYEHPLLAVLLNPIHVAFVNPRLWEAEGIVGKRDGYLKCGCHTLTTIQEIPLPTVTITQRVAFGIYCGLAVCNDKLWVAWANDWISGKDRSQAAAWAAWAARAAAEAACMAARAEAACATAAEAACMAARELNLIDFAERAMEIK